MLEALFILGAGSLVREVVGGLFAAEMVANKAETAVSDFGRKVEDRTRAVCAEETAQAILETSRETTAKAVAALEQQQQAHQRELENISCAVAQETVRRLHAAGWRPPQK